MVSDFLAWVARVPDPVVYAALGLGAALENVVPAVPADTFVLLGGFVAGLGEVDARWVFAATWSCNVASALLMYRLGHTHGRPFFESGWGRRLLNPRQMERVRGFYDRWGTFAIFFTRFLPGLRAVVPVFAGVSHQRWLPVAIPLTVASAIWYGGLVWAGALAGTNLDAVRAWIAGLNRGLAAIAVAVCALIAVLWWRTRRHGTDD